MKSSLTTNIGVGIVLAVSGYFIFTAVNPALDSATVFALGLFIGALVIAFSTSLSMKEKAEDQSALKEATTLYVGNLPYRANEQAVKDYFETISEVSSVRLMKDKRTGKRKGYGFVEIITDDVNKVIGALNDSVFQERTLKVRLAKDKPSE